MGEEACQVAQLALLKSMHALVLAGEKLGELLLIDFKEMAESLSNVAIEGQVSAILHATLNDHTTEFDLLPASDLKLKQLVTTFLKLDCGHDNEVDRLSELDEVFFSEIFNFLHSKVDVSDKILTYLLVVDRLIQLDCSHAVIYCLFPFHLLTFVGVLFLPLLSHDISVLPENLFLDFIPLGFFHLVVSIVFEKVQTVFSIKLFV